MLGKQHQSDQDLLRHVYLLVQMVAYEEHNAESDGKIVKKQYRIDCEQHHKAELTGSAVKKERKRVYNTVHQ